MTEIVQTGLEVIGLAAVVVGVALIFPPAGLILAGLGCLAISWRLGR